MAKAKVVHSDDACTLIFRGDKRSPEPSTGVIKFPGGHVEVSRASDGKYWAHTHIDKTAEIVDSRIDYRYEKWLETAGDIPPMPAQKDIQKMAVKVDGPYVPPENHG
ncbi:MAG: hypothetical protein RPU61_14485 [Candidatus Sedimenticola sp. (ex Thyasira tokunagai)]